MGYYDNKLNIKQLRLAVPFALATLAGYIYICPYLSILAFKNSLEEQDYESAQLYVDFSSVRNSLKIQLQSSFEQTLQKRITFPPLTSIGVALSEPFINATVDLTVTPNGLKTLLNNGYITTLSSSNKNGDKVETPSSISSKPKVRLYYLDFNNFVLSSSFKADREPINAFWKRQGLFKWTLNAIEVPSTLLDLNL